MQGQPNVLSTAICNIHMAELFNITGGPGASRQQDWMKNHPGVSQLMTEANWNTLMNSIYLVSFSTLIIKLKALPYKISLVIFFHTHQTQHRTKDNTKTGEEKTRTLETLQNVIKEVHGHSKNIIHQLDTGVCEIVVNTKNLVVNL